MYAVARLVISSVTECVAEMPILIAQSRPLTLSDCHGLRIIYTSSRSVLCERVPTNLLYILFDFASLPFCLNTFIFNIIFLTVFNISLPALDPKMAAWHCSVYAVLRDITRSRFRNRRPIIYQNLPWRRAWRAD